MPRDLAAAGFALALPTVAAWLYFVVFAAEGDSPNPAMQAIYAVAKVVQFGFPVVYLWLADPAGFRKWGLSSKGVWVGLAFGAAVAAGAFVVFDLLQRTGLLDGVAAVLRSKIAQLGLLSPAGFLALAAFLAVLHSGLEEYYWRGFVHGRLREHLPLAVALPISSLGFMAHHVVILAVYLPGRFWTVAVPLSLCIAVGGAVWAWLYERTGSLLGPWLSHALVDVAIMAVGYRLVFAP